MTDSATHLVILPAYNPGPRLRELVAEALRHWRPVLVVIDGSTDGSERAVQELARHEPALSVLTLLRNSGKGAAVLAGAEAARARGFTHALVMDADGQHPAASIAEFMAASRTAPEAVVLGQPVFPANIPAARLHGRKLSVGLVHLEILGAGIADPLFGFRVYPLAALFAVLGARSGGRRYDFDTEAAVRLCWAGVPPVNLAAPVRYFSRAEGGVSHFRYVRDNATLVWLHTRLITELLLLRWPAMRRHRRRWLSAAALLLACGLAPALRGNESDSLVTPAHRISAAADNWKDLVEAFSRRADVVADFTEKRFFPFKKEPVELAGEVRVAATRGLSLHYTAPEERVVVLDARGVLLRDAHGDKTPPADPRAAAANEALLHILSFDFPSLEKNFELYGWREGAAWTLALVPRAEAVRRTLGRITVEGEAVTVRRIEIRRSVKQCIDIVMSAPRVCAPFTAEELRRYFR